MNTITSVNANNSNGCQVIVNGHASGECDMGEEEVIAEVREEKGAISASPTLGNDDGDFAPKEAVEIEKDVEAVELLLEEDTTTGEEVDCFEQVEAGDILGGPKPGGAQEPEIGQEPKCGQESGGEEPEGDQREIGRDEDEVEEVNVAALGESEEEMGSSEPLSNETEEAEVEDKVHCAETECLASEFVGPTKMSSNLPNGISSYTSVARLAPAVKVQVGNPIEVTSRSNTVAMANAVKIFVNNETPASETRSQKLGKHELRAYNQSKRGPTNFQVPAQKCVDNRRPKANFSRWKSHQETTKDSVQKSTKPTPPTSLNEAGKSTLSAIDSGSGVVVKLAKAKNKGRRRSILSKMSLKEGGIAEDATTNETAVKPTPYQCLEETKQLLNYLQDETDSTKSASARSQEISKNGALNRNSTNETVEQESRNLKESSKSASKSVNVDTATRIQPANHDPEKQSSTTAAKVGIMKDSSSNKRISEVTTKSKKTWKQRKRARMKAMARVTEIEVGELVPKSAVTEQETEADIDTQVNKTAEESAPIKEVSKVVQKPSKAKIRRERRKRAQLRKKMAAAVAAASKTVKKTKRKSEHSAVDASTSKVDCVDATLTKGVEVGGAQAAALSKEAKSGKLQQMNPASQNVKLEEKGNPKQTPISTFRSPGKSASSPESGTKTLKIGPARDWLFRGRKLRKGARRRKIRRKNKIVRRLLSNRWFLPGVVAAAVLVLALFVLFYCYS
nr:hypothetical protein HmN_000865200 [Hymenolepis microstoma]